MRFAHDAHVIPSTGRSIRWGERVVALMALGGDVVAGLVDGVPHRGVGEAVPGNDDDLGAEVDGDGLDAGDRTDLAGDGDAAVLAGDAGDGVRDGLHDVGPFLMVMDQETRWVNAAVWTRPPTRTWRKRR